MVTQVASERPHEAGLYLYGGVGCGKTLLMDLAFYTLPVARKQRIHFHSFMLSVHAKIHERRRQVGGEADVLPAVALVIFNASWLLCFDEFQVTEVRGGRGGRAGGYAPPTALCRWQTP